MKLLISGFAFLLMGLSSACACTTFEKVPGSQILENDRALRDTKASATSRIIAYSVLSCSDDPGIRTEAMQFAIQPASPSSLRGRALLDVLASMPSYIIIARPVPNPDNDTAGFFRNYSGSVKLDNRFVDRAKGCISLSNNKECDGRSVIQVRGTHVDLADTYLYLAGQFDLNSDNVLEGLIKISRGALIPARIQLFKN
jgi:hypothetical protein